MHWKRMQGPLLAGTVAAVVAVLVPPVAAHAAPGAAAQTVDWAPCAEDTTAECGVLRVPVDWADPDGPTIDLALARRAATDPSARIGTLVINPGGPGGSGVDSALFGSYDDQLRQHFDILGFDPRGVGRSSPVLCSLDLLNQVPATIGSQADFDRAVTAGRALADDCRARSGPVIDHVDTVQTVQDIDAIRAAVGDPQLSFFGMSYGTLMAQQYAERFPSRVRAVVADSNMDHSQDGRGFAVTQAAADQDTFDEFVAGCGSLPQCALHGRDIHKFWDRLLERAGRGELPDPDDVSYHIQPAELVNFVIGSLNYGPYWEGVASELARLDEGRPLGQSSGGSAPPSGQVINFVYQATYCQDWAAPAATYAEWTATANAVRQVSPDLPGLSRAQVGGICLGWPAPPTNPPHRLVAQNSTKLLLVNSLHDPATGYQWAQSTAAQFGSHATLLTYQGWGHIAYGRTSCVDDRIDQYLIGQQLPPTGTTCAAVPPEGAGTSTASKSTAGRVSAAVVPGMTGTAPTWPQVRGKVTLPTWWAGLA